MNGLKILIFQHLVANLILGCVSTHRTQNVIYTGIGMFRLGSNIRLVDGLGNSGRVEIFYNDRWGTVCDDHWDNNDANVLCKSLGYSSGNAIALTQPHFGPGSGPIYLSSVDCKGSESHLSLCRYKQGSNIPHSCTHNRDAGVLCNPDRLVVHYPYTNGGQAIKTETTKLSTPSSQTTQGNMITTTFVPSTLPIRLSTESFFEGLHGCDKLRTITLLAHNQHYLTKSSSCNRRGNRVSESTLTTLCNAAPSEQWRKGHKVMDYCGEIPVYTAIAAFANELYTHDGRAGIFLGCSNNNGIKMITNTCQRGIEVVHIPHHSFDSYIMDSNNYYTVQW